MPNSNYRRGRSFEYTCAELWREKGYTVIRAAGSHGEFDLVAYKKDRKPELIQCKLLKEEAPAKLLVKKFKESTYPSSTYHQTIMVKVVRGELTQATI